MTPRPAAALLRIFLIILAIIVVNHAIASLRYTLDFDIRPSNEGIYHKMIMLAAVLYVVTLAIPFVPGVEIGIGLMALLGADIVPLVYACTVTGLTIGFLIGRLVPTRALARLFHDLHFTRPERLLRRFDDLPKDQKLSFLVSASSSGFARALLRHRYVALALLISLPGNFLIGGGGGIAVLAGISRLFSLPLYVLTVALAVAPVPLAVMFWGPSILAF